jgi:hypothetical protein
MQIATFTFAFKICHINAPSCDVRRIFRCTNEIRQVCVFFWLMIIFWTLTLRGRGGPPNEGIVEPVAKKKKWVPKKLKKEKKEKVAVSVIHLSSIHQTADHDEEKNK